MASTEKDTKRALAEFWNQSRSYYEQAEAANLEASPERRRMLVHLCPGDRVLDVGSGSCENALWLPPGCRYLGVDVGLQGLVMAGEKDRPGGRLQADSEALPLPDAVFDAVISTFALEHFHDPGRTLLEAARVLRPGGLLLMIGSTWDLPYEIPPSIAPSRRFAITLRRIGRQILSAIDRRQRFDIVAQPRVLSEGYLPDSDAVHVAHSWQVAQFLRAAGLEIIEHTTIPHRPDPGGPRALLRHILRSMPWWRHGWGNNLIVARRGGVLRSPEYRLLPL